MHIAPDSPGRDTIPFGAALALSLVAIAAIVGQIRGYFLTSELRPSQLAICYIFLISSTSVFGAIISRFHGIYNPLPFGTRANWA
ncbi:hypothetical protein BGZ57DRAFT_913868, partial [Hyaloscypha finlandica]